MGGDPKTPGHQGPSAPGPQDPRTLGALGPRTLGPQDPGTPTPAAAGPAAQALAVPVLAAQMKTDWFVMFSYYFWQLLSSRNGPAFLENPREPPIGQLGCIFETFYHLAVSNVMGQVTCLKHFIT